MTEEAEFLKKAAHGLKPCGGRIRGGQELLPVRAHGRPAFLFLQGGAQRFRQRVRGRFPGNPAVPAVADELRQAAAGGDDDGRPVEP